ncbi:IclR family transcriptional regulator [Streptomyces monticola]|uniref:IclR family transcriptional regulator n=1 Tax=Streptomyces monticola TaxID=2666263 RepID=A0ABW2JMM8_9ACTN
MLEAIEQTEEAGLTALTARSGLPKTTVYRLLEQLVALGVVEQHGTSYRMGPRIFRLGLGWRPHPRLRLASAAPMRRLADVTGATVGICVLREGRTLAVHGIPGTVEHLAPLQPGATWPWSTAAGKLLVALAPRGAPFGPLPVSWRRQAAAIRDAGVSLDREELVPGVCCVAAPVTTSARGDAVAALCAMVEPAQDLRQLAQAVTLAGRAVSAGLRGPARTVRRVTYPRTATSNASPPTGS